MSDVRLLIHKPLVTEKSTGLKESDNRYVGKFQSFLDRSVCTPWTVEIKQ